MENRAIANPVSRRGLWKYSRSTAAQEKDLKMMHYPEQPPVVYHVPEQRPYGRYATDQQREQRRQKDLADYIKQHRAELKQRAEDLAKERAEAQKESK